MSVRRGTGRLLRCRWTAPLLVVAALVAGLPVASASASTNASAAAGFIEQAQNADGGFSETHGQPSNPSASLWATVALLAAGKNSQNEQLNNGDSAAEYLTGHLFSYRSLEDLGLLAIVQAASGANPGQYGNPGAALKRGLTAAAIRSDPSGAAMGALGLLALKDTAAATADAKTLIGDQHKDGGWGHPDTTSATTALVLEAFGATGIAGRAETKAAIASGIAYLQTAQVNDGSIAISDRTDPSSSGDVAGTAFTIQALQALHHAQLRTSTGTTVLQGLANYQQQSGNGTGGLSPFGAYDTGVAPSVIQTAQAYPAFDGVSLPLSYVAPVPPPPAANTTTTSTKPTVNRQSTGTTTVGVSAAGASPKKAPSAYQGATATGKANAKPRPHKRSSSSSGQQVTGSVLGAAPPAAKLTSAAGRTPSKDHSALYLALALVVVALLGAAFDSRRPRGRTRPAATVAIQGVYDLVALARRRRAFAPLAVLAVGAALILIPPLTGMWSRAPRGATMVKQFAPYMRTAHVVKLQGELTLLNDGFREARKLPEAASFARSQWPPVDRRFQTVLSTIEAQHKNFGAVSSLPTLRLFPWFLVIPGALLALLAAIPLAAPGTWSRMRLGVGLLGALLILAPVALGLFGAGVQGSRMVSAFATVENSATATSLQQGFSSLVIGESDVATALPAAGHAAAVARTRYPAASRMDARWVPILGDFTPLLGVMNNNLGNYRAVASLPDFETFPWLFVIPGLLALVIALAGLRPPRRRRSGRRPAAPTPTHVDTKELVG
jgi:hypothetical protein